MVQNEFSLHEMRDIGQSGIRTRREVIRSKVLRYQTSHSIGNSTGFKGKPIFYDKSRKLLRDRKFLDTV